MQLTCLSQGDRLGFNIELTSDSPKAIPYAFRLRSFCSELP